MNRKKRWQAQSDRYPTRSTPPRPGIMPLVATKVINCRIPCERIAERWKTVKTGTQRLFPLNASINRANDA